MEKLTPRQKEDLKLFRERRGGVPEALRARQKTLSRKQRAIQEALSKGPATVPSLAVQVDLPTDETLWYLAWMRKYGQIEERGQDGDYPRYALVDGEEKQPEPEEGTS